MDKMTHSAHYPLWATEVANLCQDGRWLNETGLPGGTTFIGAIFKADLISFFRRSPPKQGKLSGLHRFAATKWKSRATMMIAEAPRRKPDSLPCSRAWPGNQRKQPVLMGKSLFTKQRKRFGS
ncbi:MAG: hypothetical protein ACKV2V_31170 [Blastocatellia bacterium]